VKEDINNSKNDISRKESPNVRKLQNKKDSESDNYEDDNYENEFETEADQNEDPMEKLRKKIK